MVQGSLARKLRVLRAERGWTLREAASKIGVTKETLSDLERGRRHPHDLTLGRVAEGYGVSVGELLEEPELAGKKAEAAQVAAPAGAGGEGLVLRGPGGTVLEVSGSEGRIWVRDDMISLPIEQAVEILEDVDAGRLSLQEAAQAAATRSRGSAEGHLTYFGRLEDLTPEQIVEILEGVRDGRITVNEAARQLTKTS